MQVTIPFVDQTVSTDDPASSASSFAAAIMGVVGLFGIVGIANYLYSRLADVAGVDSDQEIPVV